MAAAKSLSTCNLNRFSCNRPECNFLLVHHKQHSHRHVLPSKSNLTLPCLQFSDSQGRSLPNQRHKLGSDGHHRSRRTFHRPKYLFKINGMQSPCQMLHRWGIPSFYLGWAPLYLPNLQLFEKENTSGLQTRVCLFGWLVVLFCFVLFVYFARQTW